jgi:hydrogenase/urease accessory protein HupE
MSAVIRASFVLVLLVACDTAFARPVFGGVGGFTGGLLHPLFVPAHVLAIVGAGLLIAQEKQRGARITPWPGPIAFAAGLAAGFVTIAGAYVPMLAEEALLALAAISGIWVAVARPFLRFTPILLATLTGLAVALDSPPDVLSIREALLMQLGTFCGAALFYIVLIEAASRLARNWQRVGVRILGSWIAASAILVLALQLTR